MIYLSKRQADLMLEAGVSADALKHYVYTAEDEDKLADLLMEALAPGQEWSEKAQEIQDLLNYLAMDA